MELHAVQRVVRKTVARDRLPALQVEDAQRAVRPA